MLGAIAGNIIRTKHEIGFAGAVSPHVAGGEGSVCAAFERFELDRCGIHGVAHWGRARANGLRLAAMTGARTAVIEAFALLHDSCCGDDNDDPDHGERAAEFAKYLSVRRLLTLDLL